MQNEPFETIIPASAVAAMESDGWSHGSHWHAGVVGAVNGHDLKFEQVDGVTEAAVPQTPDPLPDADLAALLEQ